MLRAEVAVLICVLMGCKSPVQSLRQRQIDEGGSKTKPIAVLAVVTGTLSKKQLADGGVYASSSSTYKFSYRDVSSAGAIDFGDGDTASLTIAKGLPVGQTGKITFDVLEGSVVKLHGEKDNVVLAAGANSLDIDLVRTDTPTSASLTVNLKVDPDPNPNPGPSPAPDPVTPDDSSKGVPTAWDLKSCLGNSEWNVVADAK